MNPLKYRHFCFLLLLALYTTKITHSEIITGSTGIGATFLSNLGLNQQFSQTQLLEGRLSSNPDIERYQLSILQENKRMIEQHNSQQNITYKLGLNQFALATASQISVTLSLFDSTIESIQLAKSQKKSPTYFANTQGSTNNTQQANYIISQTSTSLYTKEELQNPIIQRVRDRLLAQNYSEEEIAEYLKRFTFSSRASPSDPLPQNSQQNNQRRLQQQTNNKILIYLADSRSSFLTEQKIPEKELSNYNVDWTCISGSIRNQGATCGSCYAFASTDAYSMVMAIYQYGFFVSMSSQALLECPKNSLTYGCFGGFLEGAYLYMMSEGIVNEIWYPYSQQTFTQKKLGQCKNVPNKKYKIKNFFYKLHNDCDAVRRKLIDQPMAIGIAAKPMFFYKSGVFNGCTETSKVDHAVVVIGYKAGIGWKIKNSWGRTWGEYGYGWIADGNTCGICERTFCIEPQDENTFLNYIQRKRKVCPDRVF